VDVSFAEERSQIEDDQEEGAKGLSGPGGKAATGNGVYSFVFKCHSNDTHSGTLARVGRRKMHMEYWRNPLTVENHLQYDSVNGRIRLKWFKGTTRN
jgi:hypothetical protein